MNVLFVASQAASDPLMESQAFSYIREISKKQDIQFSLITFETKESLASSKSYISNFEYPIKWKFVMYRNRPRFLANCFNIISGFIAFLLIARTDKLDIVHARGLIPALISFIPVKLLRIKFFFDTRGLLAEKYVGGGLLSQKSLLYKAMRFGEDMLLEMSDYFTVETHRHAEIIKKTSDHLSEKMDVIPCCVDMKKFSYNPSRDDKSNILKLVYLGKSESWYLISEMLDFFKVLNEDLPNTSFLFLTQDEPDLFLKAAREKGIDDSKISIIKPQKGEVPELLAEADVGIFFINPYKRYNSSPVKFGEYLACGLPVIVNSGVGDCSEVTVNEKIGVVINEFSEAEYTRATFELKELLSGGEVLRKKCRTVADEQVSLEMGATIYWNIYKRLLTA